MDDHYLGDGFDDSGARTMSSLSGNVGASWSFGDQFVPYVNVSTSFETPTTTELVNQPDGSGGFNPDLGPQRAVNYEIGARGQPTPRVTYSVALFLGRITRRDRPGRGDRRPRVLRQRGEDPQRRRRGRAHRHAGHAACTLSGAYTYAHYRFASRATFDGNRLPGVPITSGGSGSGPRCPTGSSSTPTTRSAPRWRPTTPTRSSCDSWGAGVTNLRLGWHGDVGQPAALARFSA